MPADTLDTFEDSLLGTATGEVVPAAEFADTLDEYLEPPAIGVGLPFEGVELPDGVETDYAPSDLERAATGVTPAGLGVASYGTVTIRSRSAGDELVSLYSDRHVAVLRASDVVPDMPAAFERLGEEFAAGEDTQVLATGPSATADMGSLVEGVHGPNDVVVVVLEDR